MKKLTTRMLSIMTTIVMILTMLPLTAFADKTNVKRHVKHKKRENPKKAVKKQNTPYKLRIYGVYEV